MENDAATVLAHIRQLFVYEPQTGRLVRRIATGRHGCHPAGVVAGTTTNKGYVVIYINGRRFMAHRLVWLLHKGKWPAADLDHINENKTDNRIENLREATRAQNMQNVKIHKHNTSGCKGVAWHTSRGKWRAYIFCDYQQRHLGLFDTFADAVAARKTAERQLHSHGKG